MTLAEIIARIRAECPSFAHVSDSLTSASAFELPAALVEPLRRTAAPAQFVGQHLQTVPYLFGVYVMLERKMPIGAEASPSVSWDVLCAELQTALAGWQPHQFEAPVSYAGGQTARYNDQIACWREDFSTSYQIRSIA